MQRQRRYHRRSRNGCQQCKARHIRCDSKGTSRLRAERRENKQNNSENCKKTGARCVYSDPGLSPGSLPDVSAQGGGGETSASGSLSSTPTIPAGEDGATNLLSRLSPDSRRGFELMRESKNRRLADLPTRGKAAESDSFVIRTLMSQPGFLNGALIIEGIKRVWAGEPMEGVQVPLLHKKVETVRFVSQNIQQHETATRGETVFSVVALTLLEASLVECGFELDVSAVETHIGGLNRMLDSLPRPEGGLPKTLLQRVILMVSRGSFGTGSIREQLEVMGKSHVALMKLAGCTDAELDFWRGIGPWPDMGEDSRQQHKSRWNHSDTAAYCRKSRGHFVLTFLYLIATLRDYMVTPFLLHWLVDHLLEELTSSQGGMTRGVLDRASWFWTAMYGAIAARSAAAASRTEDVEEIEAWRKAFDAKLRLSSSVMGIKDWQSALAALGAVNWDEASLPAEGQEEVRAIWEQAVAD